MERFSVKKPFTILVMVIMILVLGFVAVTRLSTDLLPQMSLPYLMVITTYPGASPEKIESTISEPMERGLGVISGVKNVYSTSSDNYSMTQLEFEDGTDMDSALVKVSSAVDEVAAQLPDDVGTPAIMEISMDMMATMYVAVSREGYDIYELSDYVRDDVVPFIERQKGIASVTTIGLVDKSIQVELNKDKIDAINERILEKTSKALADARAELDDAQDKVDSGRAALEEQESRFGQTVSEALFSELQTQAGDLSYRLQAGLVDLMNRLIDLQHAVDQLPSVSDAATPALSEADAALREAQTYADEAANTVEDAAAGAAPESANPSADIVPTTPEEAYAAIDGALTEAQRSEIQAMLTEAFSQLQAAQAEQSSSFSDLMQQAANISAAMGQLENAISAIDAADPKGQLSSELSALRGQLDELYAQIDQIPSLLSQLEDGFGSLQQGQLDAALGFAAAQAELSDAQKQLDAARTQYEDAREKALEEANLDKLLSTETLSGLIYAQNFAMPAGYIDDKYDNAWLLKVGENYSDEEEISDSLLVKLDEIGDIRLADVADISIIDNAGESYAKLNGTDAICLCIYKSSTSGTHEVSTTTKKALAQLSDDQPGTEVVPLMDQGIYIDLIIDSILSSMLLGALLAIVVLALFLRAVRPTLVVAISIPLSVLFTIVLMYFSGLSLNMMTLSGLALGIGMLVDNSIVVMENIFRLRSAGVPAARAAVQGAKQVRGAIIASTLTTVCVFLPMVFTTGTVRELLIPMALSIGYCLMASLVVALTVVPAAASTLMRNMKPRGAGIFARVSEGYGKALRWCLAHKLVPLLLAVVLLAGTVWQVLRMGVVLIPEIASSDIEVDITTDEALTREDSYRKIDEVVDALIPIEGVENVGVIDGASATALFSSMGGDSSQYGDYICYVGADPEASPEELTRVKERIREATGPIDHCEVKVMSTDMSDMSMLTSQSDLTINLCGNDLEKLAAYGEEVRGLIEEVDGFTNVSDGTEDGEETLHLVIDRDKATEYGLTVAQIYTEISARLATTVTATQITVDDMEMRVELSDPTDPLTKENLMDLEFTSPAQAEMPDSLEEMAYSADADGETHRLREFAELKETTSLASINRENQTRYLTVTADIDEGENLTLLVRQLKTKLDPYAESLPRGYTLEIAGQSETINDMIRQMGLLLMLGILFIYLVMVAQFQSLLSPFIVLFTVPLAFTGGMLGLLASRQPLSMLSLMGFLILVGTVVNNGIVFVDYANQLRIGGLARRDALVATGQTRMRPIIMTALTTILAMAQLMFGKGMGSQLGSGMAVVIAGGLLYATLMTLFIIPVLYDIFFRRQPLAVDVGDDINDEIDDAAAYLEAHRNTVDEDAPE